MLRIANYHLRSARMLMNDRKHLYVQLLRIFLKAGAFFGLVVGLFLWALTNWRIGLCYGLFSASLLITGVPVVLATVSTIRRRYSNK